MRLKALADMVIARNDPSNRRATDLEKDAQLEPVSGGEKLRGLEIVETAWQPTEAELSEAVREVYEERAAIQEYDGGLSRKEVETEARAAMRVYEYRLTDNGLDGPWLILLAPGCDLLEAEHSLKNRFGVDRVLGVRERGFPVNLLVEQ